MKRWKLLLLGLLLVIGLAGAIYRSKDRFFPQPRPYQEIADTLAEYGWEVIDIEVDAVGRIIKIAAIPPEDEEGYVSGFFYILEWAGEIIKPPLSGGKPIQGMYPGVLMIGELTVDGPRVLLANGKIVQAYGLERMMMLAWEALNIFLSDDSAGTPWREFFGTPDKIHRGVQQLGWFGIAYYAEYPAPEAYEVMEDGWYPAPEEPKAEPLKEEKS